MERLQHNTMNNRQEKETIAFALWGGVIIAVVLLLTTFWVSGRARAGTRRAVSRVSEFYLQELAGRRAQVISDELERHFTYIKNAMNMIEDSDLESQESLARS